MLNIFSKGKKTKKTTEAIFSLLYTPSLHVEELATVTVATSERFLVQHHAKVRASKQLKSLNILSDDQRNRGLPGQTSKYVVDPEWANETATSIRVALEDLAKFYKKHNVNTVFVFEANDLAVLQANIKEHATLAFPDIEFLSSEIILGGPEIVRGNTLQELYDARFPHHAFQIRSPLEECIAQDKIARSIYVGGRVMIQVGCPKPTVEQLTQEEFKICDLDGNGEISKEEFRDWYSSQWEKKFVSADTNGDGSISYEEFKNWYVQHEIKMKTDYKMGKP